MEEKEEEEGCTAVVPIQYRMLHRTGLMEIEECRKLLCIGKG